METALVVLVWLILGALAFVGVRSAYSRPRKPIIRPLGRAIAAAFAEQPAPPTQPDPPKLAPCPDCGTEVSIRANSCPKCGAPLRKPVNIAGARCPACGNRNSERFGPGIGCAWWILILLSLGIGLILLFFMPRRWRCFECGNEWRT